MRSKRNRSTDDFTQSTLADVRPGGDASTGLPFLDDGVVVASAIPSNMPGEGVYRFVSTRDEEGTYAMVYAPVGRPFTVRMDVIRGEQVQAWWYDPRNGEATSIGIFENQGEQVFETPAPGELLDWVLVLDDAAKGYPAPGTRADE